MLNSLFDKIYCINLDRRLDRWSQSEEQFKKLGIEVERFSAIEPSSGNTYINKGELGVLQSNLELIKKAKEQKCNNILIFEDDVEFSPNFQSLFNSFYSQIPSNWDMIYFGGNHVHGFIPTSANVVRMLGSYAIHSIVIRNTLFEKIIEILPESKKQVDVYYAELHRTHHAYCFMPHLTWQRPNYSDIAQANVDYTFLRR